MFTPHAGPPSLNRLALRSWTLRAIRYWFLEHDYHEVETPIRLPAPALEPHIEAMASDGAYLRTSPELHLKRLVAAGMPRVFEMGACFRAGERGRLHHPEFTLLEWYATDCDYLDMVEVTRDMLADVAMSVIGDTRLPAPYDAVDLSRPWETVTVREAFLAHAGWDPVAAFDEDRFDLDLVNKIEPSLPGDRAVVLKDYPAPRAALARLRADAPPVAERWELYIGGMEIANAFSELTDAAEQRRRFEQCAQVRGAANQPVYPIDEPFLAALADGLPRCSGVALGVDRLVMLLTGAETIDDVRAFGY